jgi:excisionase family DNA binding protein
MADDTQRRDLIDNLLDSDPFLTTDEVAALFRVDVKTVSRWVKSGRLRGQKSPGGGVWLIRESVARAHLERGDLS